MQGLFGYAKNATIRNVFIDNCDITGGSFTGGIAGTKDGGTIDNCKVSGTIKGNYDHHGGIVGYSVSGTITNCVSAATVEGSSYVGSIMGYPGGSWDNNYHTAATTGGVGGSGVTTGTDQTGAEIAVKITAGDGVTLTLPDASCQWNGDNLYKSGTVATLNYNVPDNNFFDKYTVNSGTISNASTKEGNHTLTGFTEDVVISGSYVSQQTDLSTAGDIIADIDSRTYDGRYYRPEPVVTVGGQLLVKDVDYTVSYSADCRNAGTHTVYVTGKGERYINQASKNFTINPFNVDGCTVSDVSNKIAYTGEEITLTPTVKRSGNTLDASTDYTFVTNPAPVQSVGNYTLTITGQGNYTGTKDVSFQVYYAAPTSLAFTAMTATTTTLTWTENGPATQWTLEYSTDKNFGTGVQTVNVSTTATTTLEGLTEDAVYYARVKAVYGDNLASDWSRVLSFQPSAKLTIGTGTNEDYYLPFHNYCNYSLTQQIYTAAEMGGKLGAICSIDFYKPNSTSCTRTIDIYMVNTAKSSFSSKTDWIAVTAADKVYSGTVTFANYAWTTITLDTPFLYDGTSNLAIIVDDNTGSYIGSTSFRTFNTTSAQALYYCDDSTNPEPFNPSSGSGTKSIKNQVRFGFQEALVLANDDSQAAAGAKNSDLIAASDGGTANVVLDGRTFYQDGDWNTICLPFDVVLEGSPLEGATAKTLTDATMDGTHVTLTFGDAVTTLEAGVPYIIKWDGAPADLVINDATGWNNFANAVNNDGNTFEGKVVRLNADITVSTMVGTSSNMFKGTFAGDGHTLTLNDLSADAAYCAPFRYVNGATISNLHTTGTVVAGSDKDKDKFRTGLVGEANGNTTINNCWSSVEISSQIADDGTHGGFVGVVQSGTTTINNCLFDGSITGSSTHSCGGFVGWTNATTKINNCLFAPSSITVVNDNRSATFSRKDNGNVTITQSYYTQTLGTAQGINASDMSNADLLAANALGSGWQENGSKVVPVMNKLTATINNPLFKNVTINATADNTVSQAEGHVKFIGYYDAFPITTPANDDIYYMTSGSTLMHTGKARTLMACRAYFQFSEAAAAREFILDFGGGEASGMMTTNSANFTNADDSWYTLGGTKLNGRPTKKGVYLRGGNKVVIK